MPDGEMVKWLATLGVGGALAGFIFYFYRRDFIRERMEMKVDGEIKSKREDRIISVIESNAVAMTKLAVGIETLSHAVAESQDRAIKNFSDLIRAVRER
jgi:hypothetical protein